MNIRRALVGVLSAVAAAALLLDVSFPGLKLASARVEPDLSYRTLDYDVTVLGNGDLRITQHFDAVCSTEFGTLLATNSTRGLLNGLAGIFGLAFAVYQGVKYAGRGEIVMAAARSEDDDDAWRATQMDMWDTREGR